MIVCASCAIKHDPQTIATYLSDLLDFCKGIQNPMRGLFLRSFLNTSVRSLLPDVPGVPLNPAALLGMYAQSSGQGSATVAS